MQNPFTLAVSGTRTGHMKAIEISFMVYSHWLSPGQGHGRMGCMVLYRKFHTAPEQGQGKIGYIPIFQVPVPVQVQYERFYIKPYNPFVHVLVLEKASVNKPWVQIIRIWQCARMTCIVRARLHWASVSMLWQCCDDTNDTGLIKNNVVASKWVATPFWSDSIVSMRTESLQSLQSCRSIDADAWCKWALNDQRQSLERYLDRYLLELPLFGGRNGSIGRDGSSANNSLSWKNRPHSLVKETSVNHLQFNTFRTSFISLFISIIQFAFLTTNIL